MLIHKTSETRRIGAYVTCSLSAMFANVLSLWLLQSRRWAHLKQKALGRGSLYNWGFTVLFGGKGEPFILQVVDH